MMSDKSINVLLIEKDSGEADLIRDMLQNAENQVFLTTCIQEPEQGVKILGRGKFNIILLNIGNSKTKGLEILQELYHKAPETPILVLTDFNDEQLGIKAIQEGAQDYLAKDQITRPLLTRSINYAIERHSMVEVLRSMALLDELTGLYNRRGFTGLARQQLLLANRNARGFILLYLDLDDLKKINDSFGHLEGDLALKEIAGILQESFRISDIIARLGGDEFVVININAGTQEVEALLERLNRELAKRNQERPFPLSLSIGVMVYDPQSPLSLDELLLRADREMYRKKALKHHNPEILAADS